MICSNKSMLQLFPINVARKLRRMIPSLCLVKSPSPQTIVFGLSDFQKESYHAWPISPYITIYHHISPYITIYHHISPYITIYHHISPYITIYHHIPMVYPIDMVNFPGLAISEMATQPPELLAAIFVIVHGQY